MTMTYVERVREELKYPDSDVFAVLDAVLRDYEFLEIAVVEERKNYHSEKHVAAAMRMAINDLFMRFGTDDLRETRMDFCREDDE